jgi:DNA-binding response OmpR family regulator
VEDDAAIREGVVDALHYHGYATLETGDGRRGGEMALGGAYDLLLLDLVLPGRDGLDILEELRAQRPTQPVIILTARSEEKDRVRGLRLGADDYVVKPFSIEELLARVEAVLRRSPERPSDIRTVSFDGGRADLARCEVLYDDGKRASLSEREGELLRYLACNQGRAISREEILSRVWRLEPRGVSTRTIDVHIGRLRQKLRDDSSPPRMLVTVHGRGYMFTGVEVLS